ncbi:hypothetical protein T8T21_16115 (plasmid) [Limimaricola variabilis]|uniref:hypothetical protein n=1 Tax=Limimaricola variabilis TaxID=1492771 RepID=UPI002AC8CF80|nr:hypothetical protein [Limimaricola variabilis]WPY96298.1 hypothetical protein T8T21_16115 [Limimaricola variabilis]
MTSFPAASSFAAALTTDNTTSSTASLDKWATLGREGYKGLPLEAWLFGYIGLHDTLCSAPCTGARRISADLTELAFSGLGGDITLRLHLETDVAGDVTSFEIEGLTAASDLPMLADLRFDTRDTANPFIGLTHCLFHIVELRSADIRAALNNPDLFHG